MSGHQRTRDELIAELHNQMAALRASCAGYDAGNLWEGPRLATVVYTLVNDGRGRSVSILTQMGLRNKINYRSHAVPNTPGNLMSWAPLVAIVVGNGIAQYVPTLNDGAPWKISELHFREWWEQPVFENAAGQQLSRMNLVFALRSKDGGSHFDAELPISSYLAMKNDGLGFGVSFGDSQAPKTIPNAHLATMRHIAFELDQSITPHL
jgi:hypothetical protein